MASNYWQFTKEKPFERNQYLLKTGQWSDCSFIVGQEPQQQTFKGHKLLLASSSPVFEAMFFGSMVEKNDGIPIEDVQPETFKILLEYIYTSKVELTLKLAQEVYYCANKYMLPYLKKECINFLMFNLSPRNACMIYEFGMFFKEQEVGEGLLDKNQTIEKLLDMCLQFIRTKTDEVLKKSTWTKIKLPTLLKVLDQDDLQIQSEVELFIAVEQWAKAECQRQCLNPTDGVFLRSVIRDALLKIRFLSLTSEEFVKSINGSLLLTIEEAHALLSNICWDSFENKIPMPGGFTTNRNKRMQSLMIQTSNFNIEKRKMMFPTNNMYKLYRYT